MSTTRKKIKVIGTKQYLNQDTGEVQEFQVVNIEERDANFHKLWLSHILHSIDLIGNQKTKFAFWILELAKARSSTRITLPKSTSLLTTPHPSNAALSIDNSP